MGHQDALDRQEMLDWVMSCWIEDIGKCKFPPLSVKMKEAILRSFIAIVVVLVSWFLLGAFAPHPGHDPHLHPTLSAVQILLMQDALHLLDIDKIVACKTTSSNYEFLQKIHKFNVFSSGATAP